MDFFHKLYIIILISIFTGLAFTTVAYSQEDDFPFEFNPAVGLGSASINGESYMQISGIVELLIWKIGFGIELDLQVSSTGNIRTENWDSVSDWVSKIIYLSYATKGDVPLYAKFGELTSYSLGHGTILGSFRNTNHDPLYKRRGLAFDLNFNFIGAESMISDVTTLPILGFRTFVRPFQFLDFIGVKLAIPIIDTLEIGYTFVDDFDPDSLLIEQEDTEGNKIVEQTDLNLLNTDLSAWGIDVGLRLMNNETLLTSMFYFDYNTITNLGSGVQSGVYGSVLPSSLNLTYKAEVLITTDGYEPNFFNSKYYNLRALKYEDAKTKKGAAGFNFVLGKVFIENEEQYVRFAMGSSFLFGDERAPSLEASFIMLGVIPKLNINITYLVEDITDLNAFIDYRTTLLATMAYKVTGAEVSVTYFKSFIWQDGTNSFIPVDSLTIGTKITF